MKLDGDLYRLTVNITGVTDVSGVQYYTGTTQQFDIAAGSYVDAPSALAFGTTGTGAYLFEENNTTISDFPFFAWARRRGNSLDGSQIFEFNKIVSSSNPTCEMMETLFPTCHQTTIEYVEDVCIATAILSQDEDGTVRLAGTPIGTDGVAIMIAGTKSLKQIQLPTAVVQSPADPICLPIICSPCDLTTEPVCDDVVFQSPLYTTITATLSDPLFPDNPCSGLTGGMTVVMYYTPLNPLPATVPLFDYGVLLYSSDVIVICSTELRLCVIGECSESVCAVTFTYMTPDFTSFVGGSSGPITESPVSGDFITCPGDVTNYPVDGGGNSGNWFTAIFNANFSPDGCCVGDYPGGDYVWTLTGVGG